MTGTTEGGQTIRYVGRASTHPFLHIHNMPRVTGVMRVEVHVFGPHLECIVSRHNTLWTDTPWSDGSSETQLPANPNPALCSW
jgi:hypothetical protein